MFKPDNYKLVYRIGTVKKTFREYLLQSADIPGLLPDLIRTEKNNGFNSITGAENLLKIRNATNWTKCNLAGLRPTGTPNFYYSDLPINGVKSLIVVFIPDDWETVVLKVCKQFYPHNPADRQRIINEIIKTF
ncbi:hypothetical protein [Soonwooa sp.]|uniref:hypothetical protein n=1 Tax=Soonwooa sp. TaxID=1938592 RepID=UPI0028AB13DA|nr:hypothetical protein [Soonwooa sp.]